jgi:hypothetical protein
MASTAGKISPDIGASIPELYLTTKRIGDNSKEIR